METVTIPPCSACNAPGDARVWREVVTQGELRIRSDEHAWLGSRMNGLVCTYCGNVMLYVDPNDFVKPS